MWRTLSSAVRRSLGLPDATARAERLVQREADLAVLAVLLGKRPVEEAVELSSKVMELEVHDAVEQQVEQLLRGMDKSFSEAARASAEVQTQRIGGAEGRAEATETSFSHGPLDNAVSDLAALRGEDAVAAQAELVEELVRKHCGFSVDVEESLIEGAGQGAFVRGHAPRGTVVALYPGAVYLPFQVQRIVDAMHRGRGTQDERIAAEAYHALFGSLENRNPFTIQRFDSVIINAAEGSVSTKPNFFAVGHKINHPPHGYAPNVMVCPFNFTRRFVESNPWAVSLVPNKYSENASITPPWWWYLTDKNIHVQSMAFVAVRDLEDGEELFVNYRFNPALREHWPSWYHQVDAESDQLRWSGSDPS